MSNERKGLSWVGEPSEDKATVKSLVKEDEAEVF